jgi:FMN phosphatase YigB (HAD superfamily)
MIDTILIDLDGTLLHFSQKAFISAYFAELGKVFTRLGMDVKKSSEAVWAGTKAMMENDGSALNSVRFWSAFAGYLSLDSDSIAGVEAACDAFYTNEFNAVRSVVIPSEIPERLIRSLQTKGYTVVLATNPLFPACAVETRLGWTGLAPGDFRLVTDYSCSAYCKPNPGYFREILSKIGKEPEQCIMAGNNPLEDMSAGALGIETWLVTDCLENESDVDITCFRRGPLAEFEKFIIPPLNAFGV